MGITQILLPGVLNGTWVSGALKFLWIRRVYTTNIGFIGISTLLTLICFFHPEVCLQIRSPLRGILIYEFTARQNNKDGPSSFCLR